MFSKMPLLPWSLQKFSIARPLGQRFEEKRDETGTKTQSTHDFFNLASKGTMDTMFDTCRKDSKTAKKSR